MEFVSGFRCFVPGAVFYGKRDMDEMWAFAKKKLKMDCLSIKGNEVCGCCEMKLQVL